MANFDFFWKIWAFLKILGEFLSWNFGSFHLGDILGDFLMKLGEIFARSSGHTVHHSSPNAIPIRLTFMPSYSKSMHFYLLLQKSILPYKCIGRYLAPREKS